VSRFKPVVLDLFCGAGGAAMGYARAGFKVIGVDLAPQPNYPFQFHQMDALDFIYDNLYWVQPSLVHASPPCQGYSPHVTSASSQWVPTAGKDEPRLISAVRDALLYTNTPFVIENVMGARDELVDPVQLCGTMFGLDIPRHRLFETVGFKPPAPEHPKCRGVAKAAALRRGWDYRDMTVTGKGRRAGTSDRWRELLGVDWPTTQHELAEMIPPAYTEYIGKYAMEALR
jgi:hypothetical protein